MPDHRTSERLCAPPPAQAFVAEIERFAVIHNNRQAILSNNLTVPNRAAAINRTPGKTASIGTKSDPSTSAR